MKNIQLRKVDWPMIGMGDKRPEVPAESYANHARALREAMTMFGLDCLLIYGDREHYGNFKYVVGFEPRFEEGLIAFFRDPAHGDAVLLGNECLNLYKSSEIPIRGILCQSMSLPGQPMDHFISMADSLIEAGVRKGMRVGLAGWKLLHKAHGNDYEHMFCAPSYIVDACRELVGNDSLINATGIFIDPANGVRLINDVHEIASMEYGASLASEGVMNIWKHLKPDMRESDAADYLVMHGQQLTCHPTVYFGKNAFKGLRRLGFEALHVGDAVNFSMGLEGGLSCRGAYAVRTADEMPEKESGFDAQVARPYYKAVVAWYEKIGIGVTGGEMYDLIQNIIPKERFGWVLNPGHHIAFEEWLTSSIAPNSQAKFASGMLVQMDIIPSVAPFVSPNVEDGICIADDELQHKIRTLYPDVWDRFMKRRAYMENALGIHLKKEILPMSNLCARYSPYLLNPDIAYVAE